MIERITVWMGKDWDGFTFRLRPKTREMLRTKYPGAKMLPQISISFDEKAGTDAIDPEVYTHVLEILTGLEMSEIEKIGGAQFVDAVNEKVIFDLRK